jgi:hypothetical protein
MIHRLRRSDATPSPGNGRSRPAARAGLITFLDRLCLPDAVSATSKVAASFLVIMTAAPPPNVNHRLGVGRFNFFFRTSSCGGRPGFKTTGGLACSFVSAEGIADEESDDKPPDSPRKIFHHDSLAFPVLPPSFGLRTVQDTTPVLLSFRDVEETAFPRCSNT